MSTDITTLDPITLFFWSPVFHGLGTLSHMQYFVCRSFYTQYSVLIFSLSSFKILQMLVQEKLYIWFRSLLCRLRKLGVHREWGMVKHVAHHFLVALYLKKMFNYSSVIECCSLLVVAAHEDNVVDTCNADLWTCHKAILWSSCCHKLHEHCWLLVLAFLPPVSLMVDRRGLVCVMECSFMEALQNSLALHGIGCIPQPGIWEIWASAFEP